MKPISHKIHALAEDKSFLNDKTLKRDNVVLLISIILFGFVLPLIRHDGIKDWVFDILISLIIVSCVTSLKFPKQKFINLSYFGMITVALIWLNQFIPGDFSKLVAFLTFIIFIIFITYSMIMHVSKSKNVNSIMILNTINSYLLIGIISAFLFASIKIIYVYFANTSNIPIFSSVADPNFHDYIYFSYVTLTTLGYGDITPVLPAARSLAMIVSITGQLYLTILVAMLVGKYLSQSKIKKQNDKENS